MRRRFGKVISELATKDEKIVLIVGDIGYGVFDDFRKKHPKKFFNLGICEQSIIGVASGMALTAAIPLWVAMLANGKKDIRFYYPACSFSA